MNSRPQQRDASLMHQACRGDHALKPPGGMYVHPCWWAGALASVWRRLPVSYHPFQSPAQVCARGSTAAPCSVCISCGLQSSPPAACRLTPAHRRGVVMRQLPPAQWLCECARAGGGARLCRQAGQSSGCPHPLCPTMRLQLPRTAGLVLAPSRAPNPSSCKWVGVAAAVALTAADAVILLCCSDHPPGDAAAASARQALAIWQQDHLPCAM